MKGAWDLRLAVIVAAALLTAWSFVTPIFEGPDEFVHWQYARHLHDTWRLPVYGPTFGEGNSPPLYYAAIAPVAVKTVTPPPAVWIDGVDAFAMPFVPRFFLGAADDLQRYWPIRHARLLTVLMSLIAVAICARLGVEATGRLSTALLAAGVVAFLPQFTFRGSHISNDALVTTMAAATLWPIVGIVRCGFTWRRGLLASIALAAAFLTKINAICLAPALALAIVSEPVPWRARLRHLSVFGATFALVAPWCLRNVVLYGDPLAIGTMREAVAPLVIDRSLWDAHLYTQLPRDLFKTFVGYFGHMTVKMPRAAYMAYLAVMLIAAIGVLREARRDRTVARLLLVLGAIIAGAIAVVVRINLQFDQPQGRYLFPALPAIGLAMALGFDTWRRTWIARVTVAGWAVANLLILVFVVMPAYRPPLVAHISKTVTIVRPQTVRDLVPLAMDAPAAGMTAGTTAGAYEVTGARPELAADVRIAAADAAFVMFEIEARAPAPAQERWKARDLEGVLVLTRSDSARGSHDANDVNSASGAKGASGAKSATDATDANSANSANSANEPSNAELVRVPFRWRADGARRTIYLTLLNRPEWRGTVTGVRLHPIEQAADDLRGLVVIVQQLRLAGSIPSHDF